VVVAGDAETAGTSPAGARSGHHVPRRARPPLQKEGGGRGSGGKELGKGTGMIEDKGGWDGRRSIDFQTGRPARARH
jgi:hypothetical protein